MKTPSTWLDQFQFEINRALAARSLGNEGKARVCARRAAGIIIGEYFQRNTLPDPGSSAYNRLHTLTQTDSAPQEVRDIAGHFILSIDLEHNLPINADLISEAQSIARILLGNEQ